MKVKTFFPSIVQKTSNCGMHFKNMMTNCALYKCLEIRFSFYSIA